MTTMKRTMTAMLAILCTASAALVSCGDASVGTVDTAAVTQAETEAVVTEEVDPRLAYANVAPAIEDFGGYEYRMSVLVDNDVVFASAEKQHSVFGHAGFGVDPMIGQRQKIVAVVPIERNDLLGRLLSVGYCCMRVQVAFIPCFSVCINKHCSVLNLL